MKLPTVLNLEGPVVVFGGGSVGIRKVEYLSKFTKDIILVSEDTGEVPDHVKLSKTKVEVQNIHEHIPKDCVLVVAAFSDEGLNHCIAEYCMGQNILVNVVDDPEYSTVFFPALSKAGDVNVAISTSGRCPFLARKIREEADTWVGEKSHWLEVLAPIRDRIDGMEETNRLLEIIYNDPDIRELIVKGNIPAAREKAEEVINVHSKS